MEKRLFNNHADLTVNDIGTKVNQYIDQNISYLENNDDLIKWNDLPSVFLESEVDKKKFVETVIYIDELFLDELRKIKMINTLASMLVSGNIAISRIDINSLYMLVDLFVEVPTQDYEKDITILGSPLLLENVRRSTLDVDSRKELLRYLLKEASKMKLDYHDMKAVKSFHKKMNSLLRSKSVYDILGVEPYMQVSHADASKFGH
ncbi:MAG TPA: hypothetical protein IAC85_02550 [Candidatus Faecenecus gallistercoris]|uniref:Uncharacterized protein n=1 Tax=Candidatus Faecenecus gallistercoris TaxID=2840793 RepID=A0A9D0YZ45_9FIRM|nr:hypothetical protein [Bacillota bacterium]MDY4051462.1 hypothetical protein [Candidatus Faecenecus gallistercoris]CDE07445.1 unknown [Bacillus sp. CAG:988]MDD7102213.1 hypothetical protein [Bacillota bacterium]PWL72499.1 MAG: hypothetical protein DBY23_01725 [Bacillota bacterium]